MSPASDEAVRRIGNQKPLVYGTDIPIVEALSDVGEVPVEHTGQAVYSIDPQGRRWVRKRVGNTGCEEMLAEMIAWSLARQLDVPIPDGAFCSTPGEESWLSGYLPDVVHWDPSQISKISNIDGLGHILAFDAVIHNGDRHSRNLLLQADKDGVHLTCWAIDHGQALVGWPDDYKSQCTTVPATSNLAKGLPMDILEKLALAMADNMTYCSKPFTMAAVQGACLLAKEPKADIIGQTLSARLASAPELVRAYIERIRARQ